MLRRNQLSISHNTNLRTLHFSGLDVSAASSRAFVADQLFPWVAVMLGQIRSPLFNEVVFDMELPDVPDLQSFDWARIDRELSKEEFRGLTVRFYVNCTSRGRNTSLVEEVQRAISDRLPAFNFLRTWGITQHRWLPSILVLVLSSFEPAINIVSSVHTECNIEAYDHAWSIIIATLFHLLSYLLVYLADALLLLSIRFISCAFEY